MDICWKAVPYLFLYNLYNSEPGSEYLYKLPGGELASLLHAHHNNRSGSTVITKEPAITPEEQCQLIEETSNKSEEIVGDIVDKDRC